MRIMSLALSICLLAGMGRSENIVFPEDAGVIDVTRPPYSLKGDGKTDNTEALRKAFDELRGLNRTLYFPNGTYLLSDRVNISGDQPSQPHSKDRFLDIQGQSQGGVILRLRDNAPGYENADAPKTFLSLYEGKSTGDVMHSYVRNITVEIGGGNPGAAALRYLSNNSGAIYDVTIRSVDPARLGAIGLDLRQSQQGPALIKRVSVDGFDHGIEVGNSFAMVFEHITLTNQRKAGFVNNNARTTIRGLTSYNTVPALLNGKHGHITLIEAQLAGGGDTETAIVSDSSKLFMRDVGVEDYRHTIRTASGACVDGDIDEWYDGRAHSLFDCPEVKSLRLPIEETPEIPWEQDLSKWSKIEPGKDMVQQAIDHAAREGKTTVYFPKLGPGKGEGKYAITKPIRVHGSVSRIIGMENVVDIADPERAFETGAAVFTFENLTSGPVVVERFFLLGGWKCPRSVLMFENRTDHPMIVRNMAVAGLLKKPQPGRTWFMEDVVTHLRIGRGETCWARQLNPESPERNMIEVEGGQLWILGMKTEGRAAHIVATAGARVELLGGVSYQSWKNQPLDPPMFTVVDSDASFTFGFYHWNLPFTTIVEETRARRAQTLPRTALKDYHLPLYRACGGSSATPNTGAGSLTEAP